MSDDDARLRAYAGIYLRGMLMGAADIVPGVSGGTIAFITGIYDRLIAALSAFDHHLLGMLLRRQWARALQRVDAAFLAALVLGIATSVATLAQLITWLLDAQPLLVWAFFFGLIAASALVLLRQVTHWHAGPWLALLAGVATATTIALAPTTQLGEGSVALFFSGFIAICAMILPGISGSFILVLLGMYPTVLAAVETFHLPSLAVFALGGLCGLLAFSRLLNWLLTHFHALCMALLTGFLVGSLLVVWPWKLARDTAAGGLATEPAAQQIPLLPGTFARLAGESPQLLSCLLLMLAGFVAVWFIERRWGDRGA
jgi:putative membrane protein